MPPGVEHTNIAVDCPAIYDVIAASMPPGVEHR